MAWTRRSVRSGYTRRRGYNSGTMRKAAGNMRAATSMRDQSNFTIKGILSVPVLSKADQSAGMAPSTYALGGGVTAFSIWQLLLSSQYFDNYRGMFDQVKLNGFHLKIMGNSAASLTLASGLSSVGTVIGWDRSGIEGYPDYPAEGKAALTLRSCPYVQFNTTPRTYVGRVNKALSYGSSKQKPWSPGNAFTQYLTGYAQTASEKQQWIATEKLKRTTVIRQGQGAALERVVGFPSGLASRVVNPDAEENVAAQVEIVSPQVQWDPVAYIGVFNVPAIQNVEHMEQATPVFAFSVEYKIDVSFRGTRTGTVIAAATDVANGGEALDELVQSVPSGATQTFVPAEGFLWNKATITGGPPDDVGTIGMRGDGTLTDVTALAYDGLTPLNFTLTAPAAGAEDDGLRLIQLGEPKAGFSAIRVKINNPEYSRLVLALTKNGVFRGEGLYSGFDITVNVSSAVPTIRYVTLRSVASDIDLTIPLTRFQRETVDRGHELVLNYQDYFIIFHPTDQGVFNVYLLSGEYEGSIYRTYTMAGDLYYQSETPKISQLEAVLSSENRDLCRLPFRASIARAPSFTTALVRLPE